MTKRNRAKTSTRSGKTRKTRARTRGTNTRRGGTKVTRLDVTVGVHEPTPTHAKRAREVVKGLGYRLAAESSEDALLDRIRGPKRPEVILIGSRGSETFIDACHDLGSASPVVILAMSGPASGARERFEHSGADLFVLRPHSKDSLAAILTAAASLAEERRRLHAHRASEEQLRERLLRYGEADAATGFQHFDFFKKVLVTELKRAKRYNYPLAACLIALDPSDDDMPASIVRALRTRAALAVASCIRDIDIPVDFAEDRFLVFLPYTDLDGAERVGRRIAESVARDGNVEDDEFIYHISVSIGIAALPQGTVSFARLMRDSNAALRAAQLKGGGRVVVRRRSK
jgi:diguanylate cyclase (GGDEF)-like protein